MQHAWFLHVCKVLTLYVLVEDLWWKFAKPKLQGDMDTEQCMKACKSVVDAFLQECA